MSLPDRVSRYEVEVQLGQGPTGRVWLARDPLLRRPVAIKVPRDDLGLDPQALLRAVDRMREGACAAASLSHAGIATVHDVGDDGATGFFVVLELASRGSLREPMTRGRMTRHEVAHVARSIGMALAHAHAAGVVHGNVKPENVVFAATGPKLTDFAAARHPPDDVFGAVGYAAPESLSSGRITPAGDQFSLAVTLLEALTGRPVFTGADHTATSARVKSARHLAPTSLVPELRVCPHLDTIFDRALAKDPGRRFASCEAFTQAICGALEASYAPILTPVSQSSIVPRTTRRWQNAAAVGGAIVILALVIAGQQRHGPGVSLKSVASAFAATVGPPHAEPHRLRPAPVPSAAPLPSGTALPGAPHASATASPSGPTRGGAETVTATGAKPP
ncbi:MAG: serine/threonine-protein kinase [Polyangiaceae bacterium]|jgi:serine/threonine-protein kinase